MPHELLAQIRRHGPVPHHVAIIMDGSGRWARQRRLPRPFGHVLFQAIFDYQRRERRFGKVTA